MFFVDIGYELEQGKSTKKMVLDREWWFKYVIKRLIKGIEYRIFSFSQFSRGRACINDK